MCRWAVNADVVVIGGGVIGLGVAWRVSQAGLSVVVVDDQRPGRGSWAAAGMLAPLAEAMPGEERLLSLSLRSAAMYPAFVEELALASYVDSNVAADDPLLGGARRPITRQVLGAVSVKIVVV